MRSERGREIHKQALDTQEKGNFLEALRLEDEAMIVYQEEGDEIGFSEIQAMRTLTYRHLHGRTGFVGYLVKAKHEAEASLDLAQRTGDEASLPIPLVGVARIMFDLGEYAHAAKNFDRAIALASKYGERKSVIADFKVHFYVCLFMAGDRDALKGAEEALSELAMTNDASEYEKSVWMSGAHMKMAEAVNEIDHDRAMEHMRKAKQIIDGNDQLSLRLEQWNKLMDKLRS